MQELSVKLAVKLSVHYSTPEPMVRAYPPSGPMQNCTADILHVGPLPSGENLFVIVDKYGSSYPEVNYKHKGHRQP